jgi:hypothetical protein
MCRPNEQSPPHVSDGGLAAFHETLPRSVVVFVESKR